MGARILVVEDEGIVAMELARRIESMGHEVRGPVGSAAEALELVEAGAEVDIAVLDVRLRGQQRGTELAMVLRERHGIPAIFLTAYSDDDTLRQIKQCEPLGYLLKPLDERSLWVVLETALYTHEISRQRAEAELAKQRSDALYASIVDHTHDGIISVDVDQTITVFNKGAELLFGHRAQEVLGKPLSMLLPESTRDAHAEHMRRYAHSEDAGRRMGETLEVWGLRRDGTRVPVEVSISRIELDDDVTFTAIVRDVSTRRAVEARLGQAERFQALGRLAGGIAHDFNNLLTGVVGYAKLLDRSFEAGDPRRQDVQEIRVAGERAGQLVKELLAYASRQSMKTERIAPNALIERLRSMLSTLLGAEVHLEFSLARDLPDLVTDPVKLEQVVMNLVLNARDAMPDGGIVSIETRAATERERRALLTTDADHPAVVVSVSDQGVGIDEQTQRHIFEPFFTTRKEQGGTGLGLATSYGTIRQCGGVITVESTPGEGTTFRVILPAAPGQTDAPAPHDPPELPASNGTATVLLAEDESLVRDLAARLLREDGYRVLVAADGEEAWQLVESHGDDIDLLLTDMVMPGLDGYELARRWHERFPRSPVLLMTAYAEKALHLDAFDERVTVLEKPFLPDALSRVVAELVA